jgi:hypothetical protein
MAHVFVPMIFTVSVVLVDLDDTLIPGVCARDRSVLHVLRQFGAREDVETALAVVREEWRASGLREVAELAGVSSWEALWTGFSEAVERSDVLEAGTRFQDAVWRSLVPGVPREKASSAFRSDERGPLPVGPVLAGQLAGSLHAVVRDERIGLAPAPQALTGRTCGDLPGGGHIR